LGVKPELVHDDAAKIDAAVADVVALARFAGSRGFIPATSGNFSARIDARRAAVTASGSDKSELAADGVIVAEIDGAPHPRASAEAPLHLALYRDDPEIGAVAHVHHFAGTLLSRRYASRGALPIEGFELQKAFRGVTTHETRIEVPIFANDQDMERLAPVVSARLKSSAPVFGYLLAGHGLYVWGRDAKDARRHLEAFDTLFNLILHEEGRP
jgi:methylthioribulose-1-phosphate dehydratase